MLPFRPVKLLSAVLALFVMALPNGQAANDIPVFIDSHKPLTSTAMIYSPRGGNLASQGSGWLVDRQARLLVTNRHVVDDGEQAAVIFPTYLNAQARVDRAYYEREAPKYRGKVVYRDAQRDLALIELVDAMPPAVAELKLAEKSPAKDARIHTSGNPGSANQCFVYSAGNVRDVSRSKLEYDNKQKVNAVVTRIVTDTKLGPGVSGGPVVNDRCELVAVMAAGPRLALKDEANSVQCIDVSEVRTFMADAHRSMATTAIGKKNYDKAIDLCTRALTYNAKDALSHNERGVAYAWLNKHDQAIADYTKAIALDDRLARAFRNRGSAYFHKGKYNESVDDCTEAIKRDDKYALAYLSRSKALKKLNRDAEAKADYEKAVQLDMSLR